MSIFPLYTNQVGASIESGEELVLDMVLLDETGTPIPLTKYYPEDLETVISMVLDWRVQDLDSMVWLTYTIGDCVYVVDAEKGHVRLVIPMDILKSDRGYRHILMGFWDDEEPSTMTLLGKGRIEIRNSIHGLVSGLGV